MNRDLFRHEILDAQRTSWLGTISLVRPLGMWAITGFSMAMALVICGFIIFGEYTKRSKMEGILVPDLGLATVVAPVNGVMRKIYLDEGSHVQTGEPLAHVDIPKITSSGSNSLAVIREGLNLRELSLQKLEISQNKQIDSKFYGLLKQVSNARRELEQIRNEINTVMTHRFLLRSRG